MSTPLTQTIMKRIFSLLLIAMLAAIVASAQIEKASDVFLEADKTLLEPSETARLSIVAVLRNDPTDGNPDGKPYSETILPPNNSVYRAANWRIVEGAGKLAGVDETTQTYTAPTTISNAAKVVVSVELTPLRPKLPKVTLFQTLYLNDNETAFVVNVPSIGVVNSKFVARLNKGATTPKIIDVPANIPPEVRRKLEQSQKEIESNKIDLNAISGNGAAIYDAEQKFTAVRFSELGAQMIDGKINQKPGKDAVLVFNFRGNQIGVFQIGEEKTGLGLFVTAAQVGFGCGDTESADDKLTCSGTVRITEIDTKFIKGTVRATIYTSVDDKIFRGNFYGKFIARRVN